MLYRIYVTSCLRDLLFYWVYVQELFFSKMHTSKGTPLKILVQQLGLRDEANTVISPAMRLILMQVKTIKQLLRRI